MIAPRASALQQPSTGRSRFSGRIVATRADGTPFHQPPAASLADRAPSVASHPTVRVVEAGVNTEIPDGRRRREA